VRPLCVCVGYMCVCVCVSVGGFGCCVSLPSLSLSPATYSLTPMHVAAGVGDEIALQNLVRHGATTGLHIEYPDAVNRTALFFALLADSKYCTEILLQ
jgi:hypothetical protein